MQKRKNRFSRGMKAAGWRERLFEFPAILSTLLLMSDSGNRILHQLERKMGFIALPQLLRWVAGFQVLCWALNLFSPEFLQWIQFDRASILQGEVWRLFSWVFYPTSRNVLFVVIMAMFTFFISDSLESEWGAFRVSLYVFSTILLLSLIAMLPMTAGAGILLNYVFFTAIVLAFATQFPEHVIYLLGVIPIKAKWLGWASAALMLGQVFRSPLPHLVALVVVTGFIPYLVTFIPVFRERMKRAGEVAERRGRLKETEASGEAFHACDTCGATDLAHPERDFRVTAEGRELCSECRALAARQSGTGR